MQVVSTGTVPLDLIKTADNDIQIDRPRINPALIIFRFVNYELINLKFSEHLLYCIIFEEKNSSLVLQEVKQLCIV